MNPTAHIKLLLTTLLIALAVFATACGAAATNDSVALDSSTDTTASLEALEAIEDHSRHGVCCSGRPR